MEHSILQLLTTVMPLAGLWTAMMLTVVSSCVVLFPSEPEEYGPDKRLPTLKR